MTILLLAQVFPPRHGGSGRWMWELYRRLPDVHVRIVAGAAPGDTEFDRNNDLDITRLPLSFPGWGLWHPRSAMAYARTAAAVAAARRGARADVIHCGKCLPEGLVALMVGRLAGVPVLTYVHGEELTLAHTSRELARLTGKVLNGSSRVVANSEHTKRIVVTDWSVPDERVVVMHPGVDTSRFAPGPLDDAVRARLGWTGRRVVLTVGALQKRKGQDMLIRALPAVRARCPDVLYAVVGEGWERQYLDQLARDLDVADIVQFRTPPSDDEVIECYQQCDLFALPNRQVDWDFEGFGIVLLEAQACGKPVIAGRSGGTVETMEPSVTGEIVPCDEPGALGDALVTLLEDPVRRARMGAAARQRTVERFDWSALATRAAQMFSAAPPRR